MTIGSPSPNSVTGYWEFQYEVTANMEASNTLSWGTTKTEAETKTETWSQSITSTVEAGFEVEGFSAKASVSATLGHEYAQQYESTWSTSQEETFGIAFSTDQVGEVLWVWQWKFHITDSFGNIVSSASKQYALTKGMKQPPQCHPGYNTDEYYQVCEAGLYLPGYGPPSTRRNLRVISKD
jgi:hypothetical protein